MILTANQLSVITDGHCTRIAAIKVTAVASLTDHLINCPLILVYGQSNITQLTLAINYSKTITLMYQLD